MPGNKTIAAGLRLAGLSMLALSLAGCSYDYWQRTDRIAYSAGNAVKANIARETANPTSGAMYDTGGLGKDGVVAEPPKP